MNTSGLRLLRPCLGRKLPISRTAHGRISTSARCSIHVRHSHSSGRTPYGAAEKELVLEEGQVRPALDNRIKYLKEVGALVYPRIKQDKWAMSFSEFVNKYKDLEAGERTKESVTLRGRVHVHRVSGKRLMFIEMFSEGITVQAILNYTQLSDMEDLTLRQYQNFTGVVRRGDIISVTGTVRRTSRKDGSEQLSIEVIQLPEFLTPAISLLPTKLDNPETCIRHRHVDLLIHHKVANVLRLRSHLIQHIRNFLVNDDFLEFQTPLIADKASGAIAKPFETVATEFSEKQLALRIAPELWLKRLVIGGMQRVFEIGPVFRNEGLDATHNPEFTTCEFYKSFAELEELISMTEQIMTGLAELTVRLQNSTLGGMPKLDPELFKTPFQRIEFVPSIEKALGESLPDLAQDDAVAKLLELFSKHSIKVPQSPTLPRLLDRLASLYIEPDCESPTFIMYHPACMAPLSKSFFCPLTKQHLSARAELFVRKQEIANMYEEENSPFEQRAKFVQQLQWADDENRATVDENYLRALETGLPPTGGWGAGIDRICMLFAGASRINDVLPFGNLRNVVNLGTETEVKTGTLKVEEKAEKEEKAEGK